MEKFEFHGLSQIGQVSIRVHDVERAIAFYRDKLGMTFLFQVPRMAFFDCAGVRLLLSLPESPAEDHPCSIFYFKVPDIDAYAQELKNRGVPFLSDPHLIARTPDHDLWMAFFYDPDQNTLALMSEVKIENREE